MELSESNPELVERASAGDEVALTLLLTRSRAGLCRYVAGKTAEHLQARIPADDIVQEAHAEVFRRIVTFENRGPGSFDRWVATIAIRYLGLLIQTFK